MQLPDALLTSLEKTSGFNKESFIKIHESGNQVTSIRFNPQKISFDSERDILADHSPLNVHKRIPWTNHGYYLESRPSFTFDPLFHAGCYYVQEASSMFIEQAFRQCTDLTKPLKVLDLCAAPGGKSTHILSLISEDSLLVSNEVIRSRANILRDNIIKWGNRNVIVTNNDPADFRQLKNFFDVILVDAPCSGSGLFRREPEAIEEWSENNVALCSQRQQRILADILPSLKDDGLLIYSTCSYSIEEDEEIAAWLNKEHALTNCELLINSDWNIVKSDSGYRFWPDKLMGEGFFISCIRSRNKGYDYQQKTKRREEKKSKDHSAVLSQYIKMENLSFINVKEEIYAFPIVLEPYFQYLQTKLRIINTGVRIGEIIKDKLVPAHSLAMSDMLKESIRKVELDHDQAINFLKKKELNLKSADKGWALITFHNFPLGWINILQNRINNYYPKELRILKD